MKNLDNTSVSFLKDVVSDPTATDSQLRVYILAAITKIEDLEDKNQNLSCKVRELEMSLDNLRAAVMR
ncbi:MAG: hypothetical protein RJB16_273 [Bacteroidota bacterium]|jgi:hypothetical protein